MKTAENTRFSEISFSLNPLLYEQVTKFLYGCASIKKVFFPWTTKNIKSICISGRPGLVYAGCRGVAQPGRVLAWGARGRRFDSCHPDHKIQIN